MFWRLLALLTLIPLAELALLLEIGKYIGTWRTVGLVVLTGIVGAFMASREGTAVFRRIRLEVSGGQIPSGSLLEAGLVVAGGLLLLTPGLMTDLVGFACLMPPSRRQLRNWIARRVEHFIMHSF
ncbi:MAG: FxsA family protein [Bacillota bacterium]